MNNTYQSTESFGDISVVTAATTFLLAAFGILLVYQRTHKRDKIQNNDLDIETLGLKKIPMFSPVYPIIGNVPIFTPFPKLIEWIKGVSKNCGGLVRVKIFHQEILFINSARNVEALLKSKEYGHHTRPANVHEMAGPFFKNGLTLSSGPFWQKQRKILMRSQSYQSLQRHMESLCWHSMHLVNTLETLFQDGRPHQIKHLVGNNLLGVIIEMLTGFRGLGKEEFIQFQHNIETYTEIACKRVINPFVRAFWRLLPISRKFYSTADRLRNFTEQRVKESKLRQNDRNISIGNSETRTAIDDLLDEGTDEQQVINELNTMIFAGYDTGTQTLIYFLMCMALNPEKQKKCQGEVDDLFSQQLEKWNNGNISLETVKGGLKYVEQCILETLRIFPVAFILVRELQSPLEITYNKKPVLVPAGTSVSVSPYILHRNEKYYPNPEKFDPDRFSKSEMEKRHCCAYIPFSAGPKNCVGQKFAIVELKTTAAYLLRNFEFETLDTFESVSLLATLILTPERDYRFVLKKRNVN